MIGGQEIVDLPLMMQRSESFQSEYPWIDDYNKKQRDLYWEPNDYNAADDMQSYKTKLNDKQREMVVTLMGIFTHYEVFLGQDFWNGKFKRMFPRYEFHRAGSTFGFMESSVHEIFYNQINQALGLIDKDFHDTPYNCPVLSERVKFIKDAVKSNNPLEVLASFCFLEGAVLFSSFAALSEFNKPNGINAMTNLVSGLKHSILDEITHAEATGACFQQLSLELGVDYDTTKIEKAVLAHEEAILKKIDRLDLLPFVEHRIQMCRGYMGKEVKDIPTETAKWFYIGIEAGHSHDFFAVSGRDYKKSCKIEDFKWIG